MLTVEVHYNLDNIIISVDGGHEAFPLEHRCLMHFSEFERPVLDLLSCHLYHYCCFFFLLK